MSQYPPFGYTIYRIFTHLLIPFATIPIGLLFYYFSTATLPTADIAFIFHTDSDIWPSIATAIIIAPIYYIHCFFNRSELTKTWQLGLHIVFILITLAWMFYLCYRTESHFGTWTEESGRLDPIFLFTIPQIIATYVLHWFWIHKYRKALYLKWFNTPRANAK
jgi:hypothetical protein